MSKFQPYSEKKAAKLMELAVTYQSRVTIWMPGSQDQCVGRMKKLEQAADQQMLTLYIDKKFHEMYESKAIESLCMRMQVEKEMIYFNVNLGTGDEFSWNFILKSPLFKLEQREHPRFEIPFQLTSAAEVTLRASPEDLLVSAILYDISEGGLSLMIRPTELPKTARDRMTGSLRFQFGNIQVQGGFKLTNIRTMEHPRHGPRIVFGAKWTQINEQLREEIRKFIARNSRS